MVNNYLRPALVEGKGSRPTLRKTSVRKKRKVGTTAAAG
jgi:hypothetical protein